MYFQDRHEVGERLAAELEKHRYEDTVVLALTAGGAVVGERIAARLRARLSLLLTEPIQLPGSANRPTVGLIDQAGHFTFNRFMPTGQLTELVQEMHGYIESEKLQKIHKLSRAMNEEGWIDPQMFYGHHVIIVSDGMKNGLAFSAAVNYLKPINTGKIIAAAGNVSVPVVDQLHIMADEIHILDVLPNYLDTDHYFEDNELPDIHELMEKVIHRWQ